MIFNLMVIPTLVLSYVLFALGYGWSKRVRGRWQLGLGIMVGGVVAVPGILMAAYYGHGFDSWAAFYEFRSALFSELSAAGMGLLGGMVAHGGGCWRRWGGVARVIVLAVLTMAVVGPYLKPMMMPAQWSTFKDINQGPYCMQSTGYSCGPACVVTVLRYYQIAARELTIAQECYTCNSGTENWYLARALRKRGLKATFVMQEPAGEIPVPCMAGIKTGGSGHFVALFAEGDDAYRVCDPLMGTQVYSREMLRRRVEFTGLFLQVEPGVMRP